MNKIILNIFFGTLITALVAVILLGVATFLAYGRSIDNEARYKCALISKYEVKDGKATVSYPVEDVYQKCLLEKGLR